MAPTFERGEVRLCYPRISDEIERGTVVVYGHPSRPGLSWMHRVVALPGEAVEVRDGALFIDGNALEESYILEPMRYTVAPRQVGPDQVFVLGDNRNNAADSHLWGPLPIVFITCLID